MHEKWQVGTAHCILLNDTTDNDAGKQRGHEFEEGAELNVCIVVFFLN